MLAKQTEVRRFHAMMLIDRSAVGDRDQPQTLPNEAQQGYERIGMPASRRDVSDSARPLPIGESKSRTGPPPLMRPVGRCECIDVIIAVVDFGSTCPVPIHLDVRPVLYQV